MDVTLELDTKYHERKKEKNHFKEKKIEASKASFSHTQNSSSSSHKKNNFSIQKRDRSHFYILNKDNKSLGSEKETRLKEGLCPYCGGKNSFDACVKRPKKQLTQPVGKFPSQGQA
ncbi:hypothetical protein O181_131208 [Austropuccinia psidii MF-1]|uniref:Uncharacterized protein n=1 Tax=Austropuccinia psidii MF-1 TaxID=1389203 RepID=A0A9Q3L014_9BASI|nr:hypothetical protein [Austropuccinia psidii MF-1]